jgi:hypothetical protein
MEENALIDISPTNTTLGHIAETHIPDFQST